MHVEQHFTEEYIYTFYTIGTAYVVLHSGEEVIIVGPL